MVEVFGERAGRGADGGSDRPTVRLPPRRSSFVGRAAELGEIAARLGRYTVVTLVGAGGVGKTALAVEAAWSEVSTGRAELACYVDLVPCRTGDQVIAALVEGVGIRGAQAAAGLDAVVDALSGGRCHVTSTPDTQYTITDDVHHFLVDYAPPTVMISPTCGGSRRFLLHVVVSWVAGNPVKIDAGSTFGFRSATNANVIVRRVVPTTTVPNVIGVDEGSVADHLAGSGLTTGTVTRVANPARAGIVIGQNSPAGTIEPAGSPVNLTISLGAATVPDLVGDTTGQAVSQLAAVGLGARIEHTADCGDPGHVIDQTPAAGTSVAPGSTVTITIDDGTSGIICR